jgi:hypothetical protein
MPGQLHVPVHMQLSCVLILFVARPVPADPRTHLCKPGCKLSGPKMRASCFNAAGTGKPALQATPFLALRHCSPRLSMRRGDLSCSTSTVLASLLFTCEMAISVACLFSQVEHVMFRWELQRCEHAYVRTTLSAFA